MLALPPRFFVAGTDTGVGKSAVCAILMAGLGAVYWKPVQSGLPGDTAWVRQVTGLPPGRFAPETYCLGHPLSPHQAAALEGVEIDLERFSLPPSEQLMVEGAGGVMTPLNPRHIFTDLMRRLGLPVLVVARSSLGTINHTLLTLEQLRRCQLEILGVVVNGPKNAASEQAIEHYGKARVLAAVEPLEQLDPPGLRAAFERYFNAP